MAGFTVYFCLYTEFLLLLSLIIMSLFLIDLSLVAIRRDISADQKCQILRGDFINDRNLMLCASVGDGVDSIAKWQSSQLY
jgi:hypothetical protein